MRIMTRDRKRATLLTFRPDNVGKIVYDKLPVYSGYHIGDIKRALDQLSGERVLVINYQHGNTLNKLMQSLKNYPHLATLIKSKFKIIIISHKQGDICLETLRRILAEELWRYAL